MYLDIAAIFDSSRTQHVRVRVSLSELRKIFKFGRFVKGSLAAVVLSTASKIAGLLLGPSIRTSIERNFEIGQVERKYGNTVHFHLFHRTSPYLDNKSLLFITNLIR